MGCRFKNEIWKGVSRPNKGNAQYENSALPKFCGKKTARKVLTLRNNDR